MPTDSPTTPAKPADTPASQFKGAVSAIVVALVVVALARGLVFPKVFDESTVSVAAGSYYRITFTPKSTDRKLVVDVESVNGAPVEVAIIPADQLPILEQGRITLAEATGAAPAATLHQHLRQPLPGTLPRTRNGSCSSSLATRSLRFTTN